MEAYDLMIKTNHHLIRGGILSDAQKANIVRKLLAARIKSGGTHELTPQGLYDSAEKNAHRLVFYTPPFNAECFHAALVVLRFISEVVPDDKDWLGKQIAGYNRHFSDRKRHSGVRRFFWLCLSDIPFEIAESEIIRQEEYIIDQLSRGFLVKNENDDIPLYAMRNALARLPEYAYIKDIKPHIGEKDGRLRFAIGK